MSELWILVALPGVGAEQLEVVVEQRHPDRQRRAADAGRGRGTVIHRLEIPYGRFERRIELPPGRYDAVRRELTDGCLTLGPAQAVRGPVR